MKVIDMWKNVFALKIMMILLGVMLMSFGDAVWVPAGIVMMLASCWLAYSQGKGLGHAACSVTKSVERVRAAQDKAASLDKSMVAQQWSISNGVRGLFAGALVDYAINAVYIICMLIDIGDAIIPVRLVSLIVSVPYLPLVAPWYDTFAVLNWSIVLALMAGPFLLPLCQFAGYSRGPKLWDKTEKAMAQGKRRAKARSRIVKKNRNRANTPEI